MHSICTCSRYYGYGDHRTPFSEIHATSGEESLGGGLEPISGLIRQLQQLLIEQIANLTAERTKVHHEALAKELDLEALDRYFIQHGLGQDALWTIAALAPDVLELQQYFPYLAWIHPGLDRTLPKLESDIETLFKTVRAFEAHVGSEHKES